MSYSLSRFAIGSIVLGCCVASAQAQSSGAYPMNTEDRINAISAANEDSGYDDNDRSITAAGAYPMNTMDRINAGRRSNSSRSQTSGSTLRSGASASGVTVTSPSLTDRPDAWRYRWHENRWWYYGANSQWKYWTGNHWNAYQSASAAK